jgi:uroporphyrinogen-III decarboxylase
MHTFEVNLPYQEILERQTRWDKTYRFEPTDHAPVLTPFHSRYFVSMRGISPERYFWDPQVMLETQMTWKTWVMNHIHSDYFDTKSRVDQGHYGESWALGCELGFDDYEPWIKSHPVRDEKDLAALEQRDILDNPAVEHETTMRERMQAMADEYVLRFADGTEVHPAAEIKPGIESLGLFTLATDLRGPEIYIDVKLRPDFVHRLMDIVTAKVIRRLAWVKEEFGYLFPDIYICDDSSAMLSPDDYREFVLPYNLRYKQHFGGTCTVHCCGRANHLVPIWADELGVGVFWNFSYETDRHKMAQAMGGRTVLVGNVNWRSISQGTPQDVYADAMDVLEVFSPYRGHILSTTNIPPGTSADNINAMHRAALAYTEHVN